jgi:SH3 domain-containing YSC84-like protein 1
MKRIVAAALLIVSMTTWAWSQNRGAQVDRVQTASTVLSQIMSAPDRAIPDGILSGAKCIAIVPSMLKASFVFGANYGKGVATCRTEHGWSAPVFFKVTGGSFGFQAGGQASDLVLISAPMKVCNTCCKASLSLGPTRPLRPGRLAATLRPQPTLPCAPRC